VVKADVIWNLMCWPFNRPVAVCTSRRWGLWKLPQEQGKKSTDNVHRGAASGTAGELPAGLESRRAGPGAHRADHWAQ